MACAIAVIENNLILPYSTSMHFSLNLIYFLIFFHCCLSELINRSIGIVIPGRTCPLIEQMCLNTQSSILPVIMANISDTAKMEDVEDFLKTCQKR